MAQILRRGHGQQIDHIGIGVPDTEASVAQIEALTGARIALDPPEADQWYWSGTLPLSADSFIEVLGPNPNSDAPNPLRGYISGLKKPSVYFWYIAVDDIDAFSREASAAGAPLEYTTTTNAEDDPARSRVTYAALGPGFIPQKPCIIQWHRQVHRKAFLEIEVVCEVTSLDVFHPTAEQVNPALTKLGIDVPLRTGDSRLPLTLSTPKGEVVFDNSGFDARTRS